MKKCAVDLIDCAQVSKEINYTENIILFLLLNTMFKSSGCMLLTML